MAQNYTSADTSINRNRLPAIYKKLAKAGLLRGKTIDYGCGKFTEHIKVFSELNGAQWYGFDKYNLPEARNVETITYCANHDMDVAICSNVLNVIDDDNTVIEIMRILRVFAKTAYITVYEGGKSGIGRQTGPDQYQRNWKLAQYCTLAKEIGLNAKTRNGMLIITR